MTFALDCGRVAFIAAPVVYAAAAWTLDRHRWLHAPTAILCALMVFGYAGYVQVSGTDTIINQGPPAYPVR